MYEELYLNIEDKAAYLERLHMDPESFVPDLEHLDQLLWSHHRYVPFDNLDVWAKAQEPSLAIPDLFDKIVKRIRGGYCFEMNGLLEAALRTLGYDCCSVQVRIIKGRDFLPPVRHRAVFVKLGGKRYFCDAGLGFIFFLGSSEIDGGWNRYGIKAESRDGVVRVWERKEDGSAVQLLHIEDRPADPVDFINPNFCCSQDPASGFRTRLSMVIMTPEGLRENLVCSAPAPNAGEKYSPEFTVTIKDGPKTVSEKTYCGASEMERILKEDFGVDWKF